MKKYINIVTMALQNNLELPAAANNLCVNQIQDKIAFNNANHHHNIKMNT